MNDLILGSFLNMELKIKTWLIEITLSRCTCLIKKYEISDIKFDVVSHLIRQISIDEGQFAKEPKMFWSVITMFLIK